MAGDKTLKLSIWIAGKMDNSLTAAINSANGQISSLSRTLSKVGTVGLAAMGALAAGTVAALGSCVKEAESFEKSMGDVVKYVDGLADATGKISKNIWSAAEGGNGKTFEQNYKEMSNALLDLSTQIPMTAEQLTELAAAAGQSGKSINDLIQYDANGNIAGFLKDVAMVGTAMDITADQAGNWAAKWEKSLNMTHDEVMVLFDQINYLGANSATTAAEIAEVVNGAASLGQIAGMDAASTAALADAMLAMGVDSSVASTSISRMLVNMEKGSSATKKQQEAWQSLGLTAEGVAKSMQEDATGTMLDVLERIGNMDTDKQVAALNTLFGQWAIKGAAKLTGNLQTYEDALRMVSDPSLYGGSMEREFIIKASTSDAINTMMKNSLQALKIDFGTALLPAKKEFSAAMIDFMNNLRKNMPQITQLAESLGTLASRGVKKLGEALDDALPYIQKGIDYLLENGEQVASTLKTLAGVFLAMKFAPKAEGLFKGAGKLLFGKGGNADASGLGKLIGTGGLFGCGGIIDAAKTGAAMANSSMTTVSGELITNSGAAGFGQKAYNSIVGGITGIFNRKKLFSAGASNAKAWENIVGVSGKIAGAKAFLPGVAKALGSGASTMLGGAAVGAGSILGGIGGAVGIGSGIADIIKGAKTDGKDAKDNYFSGGTKIGMVGAGAAAGAGIGALFGGVGAVPGALIGAGIGGIGALFKGKDIGKALSDATEEGGWISNTVKAVDNFFTQTIPEKWNAMWDAVGGFFTETIPTWASGIWNNNIVPFFTQTIPEKWNAMWDGIGKFLTETVPYAIGYAAGKVEIFFTQTIPEKWNAMWDAVGNFFTVTVPTWASNTWNNNIVPFFTQTIPEKWNAMWNAIGNFFTVTVPTWASNIWSNNIVPFFTQDIPQFFKNLWNSITGFFNETLPSIASSIWGGIKSFFTETIPSFFSGLWGTITGNAKAGYSAATGVQPHATGGIFSSPHIGLVAEAGPESIIPLSSGRRNRALDLWTRTGRMLGIGNAVELPEIGDGDNGGPFGGGGITFAPNIVIQGNADKADVEAAMQEAYDQFCGFMERYSRMTRRTAY